MIVFFKRSLTNVSLLFSTTDWDMVYNEGGGFTLLFEILTVNVRAVTKGSKLLFIKRRLSQKVIFQLIFHTVSFSYNFTTEPFFNTGFFLYEVGGFNVYSDIRVV